MAGFDELNLKFSLDLAYIADTIPLNPKFLATSHLLRLYSLVYVGPGRKPERQVFS